MKYSFLRRLGALTLAFALALTLVPTAWAVDKTVTGTSVPYGDETRALRLTAVDASTDNDGNILLTTNGQIVNLRAEIVDGRGDPVAATETYKVTWSITREDLADLVQGTGTNDKTATIAGKAVGSGVVITAVAAEELPSGSSREPIEVSATLTANVYDVEILFDTEDENGTNQNVKEITLDEGEEIAVSARVRSGNQTTMNTVRWSIENNASDVTISSQADGSVVVKAITKGKTNYLIAESTAYSGVRARIPVIVRDPDVIAVTSVSIPETLTLTNGDRHTLTATVLPANATNKEVTWTSSDPTSVSVDDEGNLVALKVTTAPVTITAASVSDSSKKAECKVTVVAKLSGLRIEGTNANNQLELTNGFSKPGNTMTIRATASPSGAITSRDTISWSSSNENAVTVSHHPNPIYTNGLFGLLTLVGPGISTITVQSGTGDNAVKGTCTVVIPGVVITSETLTMTDNKLTMKEGQTAPLGMETYGQASTILNTSVPNWSSSDSSKVDVDRVTGVLTARKAGKATITLEVGAGSTFYEAKIEVTVVEDTEGIITLTGNYPAGSPINMNTAYGRSDAGSGTLPSVFNAISRAKTENNASYITNLSVVSTEQGILHDEHHSSEDTGAGVGFSDKYYLNANTAQGQRPLSDLSFVPRTTFSGTAEITFTGWSTNNQSFDGLIRISVNGTGDVVYASDQGAPVSFQASDFNFYHPNLKSVSFTPPQESMGILYYNYISPSSPGTKVVSGTRYNRTGTPSIDRLTFVPASGYQGTVRISYQGTDTANRSFTGTVTINVTRAGSTSTNAADIYYSVRRNSWTSFRVSDFISAGRYVLGETLSYVRLTPPPSDEGTLFYNYRGFGDFDSMVNSTTNYYYSSSPALSGVSFVATTTSPNQVDIGYIGYTTLGNTFEGTIHITVGDAVVGQQQRPLYYTVGIGRSVNFSTSDFNTVCRSATGSDLASIQFTRLPGVSQGALRYTRGNSSSPNSVTLGARFFRTGTSSSANLIGNVYFQAGSGYTGTVTIPFVGTSENGTTFTDEVTIVVGSSSSQSPAPAASANEVSYSGSTANPIQLSSVQLKASLGSAINNLSYITFTNLPSATAGRLYVSYNGVGTGYAVAPGAWYYAAGAPGIDQISFVPRGRYSGQFSVDYNAVSTSGKRAAGRILFTISNTGMSTYFSDMSYHPWAAPSVDYLYQNRVTNGVTATEYGPDEQIKRCDFVLMLYRAFKFGDSSDSGSNEIDPSDSDSSEIDSNDSSFADVPTDAYFSEAVATAKRLGVVNGDGENFRPYGQVTRQDAMVMTYNALIAAGWEVEEGTDSVLEQFSDRASVSSYARNAVKALVQMGAVTGDNGRLLPHNSITRAEAAVILHFVMTM